MITIRNKFRIANFSRASQSIFVLISNISRPSDSLDINYAIRITIHSIFSVLHTYKRLLCSQSPLFLENAIKMLFCFGIYYPSCYIATYFHFALNSLKSMPAMTHIERFKSQYPH